MNPLLDTVRTALAPEYEIEDELARGGMGVVYKGRDTRLARTVAIKIIRPERATAAVTERFLREARILAGLKHPGIVTVYHAGEADGIAYYVMAYLPGATLKERLVAGAMPPADVAAIGLDLLSALAVAHAHGVVHRDIKPANVVLEGGRAVLTDFGISKSATEDDELTLPGHRVGTPAYMPPEQDAGGVVTASADVYAAGAVLFEAWTGRRWAVERRLPAPDFIGVPPRVVPVLSRALDPSPAARWPDAAAFRQALARAVAPRHAARYAAAIALLALAIGAIGVARHRALAQPHQPLTLAFRRIGTRGAPPSAAWLGDSLRAGLERALTGMRDFSVVGAGEPATIAISGTVTVAGDSMTVALRPDTGTQELALSWRGPAADWPAAVDPIAHELLIRVLTRTGRLDLPGEALPASTAGLAAFAAAEARYARSDWNGADTAYRAALRVDSTCLLCEVRLADITRWEATGEAPHAELGQVLDHLDRLPPAYRVLFQAGQKPLGVRLRMLDEALRRYPGNGILAFQLGDELLHRGPLAGRRRAEGLAALRRAVNLSPEFAPAWDHLARLELTEGRDSQAFAANAQYRQLASATDPIAGILYWVNTIGWTWRFGPPGHGAQLMSRALADPRVLAFRALDAGPRYFLTMDEPDAALWLGHWFAAQADRPGLLVPGLVSQAVAQLAMGRRDSALAAARQLAIRVPRIDARLFAAELEAMLLRFDSLGAGRWPAVRTALRQIAAEDSATLLQRRRAAWMLALAGRPFGDSATFPAGLARDSAGPSPFATLAEADAAARTDPQRALRRSAPLADLDSAGRAGDPFFRSALHLLRAEWSQAVGRPASAVEELRWHENSDLVDGYPDVAQPVEVDVALGTLARWRRAQLLDAQEPGQPEACQAWGDLARLWATADAAIRIRLDPEHSHRTSACN